MADKEIRHYPEMMLRSAFNALAWGIEACAERGDTQRIITEYLPQLRELAADMEIVKWYKDQLK
jgi:hypothetical protein